MHKPIVLFLLFFCFGNFITAQNGDKFSLEVQAGAGSYTTFSDFQEVFYSIEGRDFNRFYGNVAESDLLPYLSLGLNYQLSERWQINPVLHYLFGEGTLYENDFTRFGVSDVNPVEQTFTAPADNEMKVLTAGINVRYRLLNVAANQFYLGTGVAYTTRSHFYRYELDVDFGADRVAQTVIERFTTEKKSAMFIPVSAGLERAISDRLILTLNAQVLFGINLEDRAWSTGLGLRYSL
ncbi:porin family protein [Neolewinella persica]|uniref:hypothetical protein n=1 Tax=Neolewinella persica TaxID=70998 RepID=UPI00037295ED|nr:hypothetical protein [Neolewinella persica]